MANVFDVAAYILEKKGEMITLKLQKLVYFAQAWSLSLDRTPLFDEKIEAWPNGPVIKDLYAYHRGQQYISSIAHGDSEKLDEDQRATVDMLLDNYGDKPVYWLERLSDSDSAWIEARGELSATDQSAAEITLDFMAHYYSSLLEIDIESLKATAEVLADREVTKRVGIDMGSHKLSTELQNIEDQVDNLYKSNPLLDLPFPTAAWHLLAAAGDDLGRILQRGLKALPSSDVSAKEFHGDLEFPMCWLYTHCEKTSQRPSERNNNHYRKAGRDLFEWGKKYASFVFAYTGGYRGVFELELQGETIQPKGKVFKGLEYEAYNDLLDIHATEEAYSFSDRKIDKNLSDEIKRSLKITGDTFSCKVNRNLVRDMKRFLEPNIDRMFSLPSDWQFSSYSLGDFRKFLR